MGTRSMNYIALQPGISLSAEVKKFLHKDTAEIVSDERGTLVVYESNFTPMWARDRVGGCEAARANNVRDLEEEIAVHRFLGSIPTNSFYMKRAGDECDYRGNWVEHSFRAEGYVAEIEAAFARELAETLAS